MKKLRNDNITAYLFLTPAFVTFMIFVFVPIIWVIVLSFNRYNVITPAEWIGLNNWRRLFNDVRLPTIVKNTFRFGVLLTPMHIFFGISLALAVNSIKSKLGKYFFRTVIYFPTLVATASVALTWIFIFNRDLGLLNYLLGLFGIEKIPWMASSFWVYPGTMIFSLWKFVGTYFLYFFIGLQGIDQTFYEAADIDGASIIKKIWYITLPMLSPTIFFVLTTMLIGVVQIFEEPFLLSQGGPGDASRTLSMYIYENAFLFHHYGFASAVSLVLLVIVLVITFFQFKLQRTWVSYDRE